MMMMNLELLGEAKPMTNKINPFLSVRRHGQLVSPE